MYGLKSWVVYLFQKLVQVKGVGSKSENESKQEPRKKQKKPSMVDKLIKQVIASYNPPKSKDSQQEILYDMYEYTSYCLHNSYS